MAFDWDGTFGPDIYIKLTNEERRYLALDPIDDEWDITRYYSKCNITYSRTTVYWDGDEIKKVIYEENRVWDDYDKPVFRSIEEYDTSLKTENRKILLPLTARGKAKPVTASNIYAVYPFGCQFYIGIDWRNEEPSAMMSIRNVRNCCSIAIGEKSRVRAIRDDADFHSFMKYYMDTCPGDYFDRIGHVRTAKHRTVKYKTGDIFRIEVDRFNYCYGLITGKIKDILKWPELPEFHSMRTLMTVPIMIRYFDLVTERSDMTVSELFRYPLSRLSICSDNDIIWGRHEIVGHKELTEDDIEFNLVCTKISNPNPHFTTHTYDMLVNDGLLSADDGYELYVEWGTASTILSFDQISEQLKVFLKDYSDPHGGVMRSIVPDLDGEWYTSKMNLLDPWNQEMKEELFRCLGLDPEADFDDFAAKLGGISKKEALSRLQQKRR